MSQYQTNQTLHNINENNYDDTVTVAVAAHEFIAVTSNVIKGGATQREISVAVMTMEGVDLPATASANSGLYIRQEHETSVKVTVFKDGTEVAQNVSAYS